MGEGKGRAPVGLMAAAKDPHHPLSSLRVSCMLNVPLKMQIAAWYQVCQGKKQQHIIPRNPCSVKRPQDHKLAFSQLVRPD